MISLAAQGVRQNYEISDLSCGYGGRPVVYVEHITLPKSSSSILVGYNGSGKSTFLKTLCGIIPPVGGRLGAVSATSCLLPEDLEFSGDLSAYAIIKALCPEDSTGEAALAALEVPRGRMYKQLSKGNRQKFRIVLTEALALSWGRDILCLDEPLSGLDLRIRRRIIEAWEGGGELGQIWGRYTGHRVISQHSGGTIANALQTLVVWDGKLYVREPLSSCEDWPLALGYS